MERKTKERRKEKEKGRGEKEGIENHLAEMRFLSDPPPHSVQGQTDRFEVGNHSKVTQRWKTKTISRPRETVSPHFVI